MYIYIYIYLFIYIYILVCLLQIALLQHPGEGLEGNAAGLQAVEAVESSMHLMEPDMLLLLLFMYNI